MIRVLQVVNIMDRAGIETMLMNYYRHIDRTNIQFDFLTHRPNGGAYDQEIISLGGKIYKAPRLYPQNYLAYFSYMDNFFKNHKEYRIVHSHIDAMSAFPLLAAKKSGIPIRIAHSHNTSFDKDYRYPIKLAAKKVLPYYATDFWGCGTEAVRFLFGNTTIDSQKCNILHNAIEPCEFAFNSEIQKEVRDLLGIKEEQFVVGHVGRFTRQKNHRFLVEIFAEIIERLPNAVLVLVGEGEDKAAISKLIEQKNLSRSVLMLGIRNDVSQLFQAMDVFVLPSFYEGLPVVAIEAQAAGLPTFVSAAITREAGIVEDYYQISLLQQPKVWADQIIDIGLNAKRNDNGNKIKDAGYDINIEYKRLEETYKSLWVRE